MQQLWTKGCGEGVGTITQPTCSFLGGMETHRKKTKELDGWQLTEVSSRGLENNTVFDFILTFMDRQWNILKNPFWILLELKYSMLTSEV